MSNTYSNYDLSVLVDCLKQTGHQSYKSFLINERNYIVANPPYSDAWRKLKNPSFCVHHGKLCPNEAIYSDELQEQVLEHFWEGIIQEHKIQEQVLEHFWEGIIQECKIGSDSNFNKSRKSHSNKQVINVLVNYDWMIREPSYRKSQDQPLCVSQIPQRKSSRIPRLASAETSVQSRSALNDVSNLFSPVTYQDIKEFND
ncbi:10013_t:CDS:2, partial [Racocetra persica]